MSTKIYDAYRFNIPGNSYLDVSNDAEGLRNIAEDVAKKLFVEQMIQTLVTALDLKNAVGNDEIERQINLALHQKDIAREADNNYTYLYWDSFAEFYRLIYDAKIRDTDDLGTCLRKASWRLTDIVRTDWHTNEILSMNRTVMQVIPYKNDVLAMLFGNVDVLSAVRRSKYLVDFHYQDQTDKPDEISIEEWNEREKVWDEAIGPDYIPARHGMTLTLVDVDKICENILYNKQRKKYILLDDIVFPNVKKRIDSIAQYIECPIQKTLEMSWSDYLDQFDA